MRDVYKPALKWTLYGLLLLVLYCLQTAPGLFEIHQVRPTFLLPFAICLAVFEGDRAGAVFGCVAGLLWDQAANKIFGFGGLILLVCCVAATLLTLYLIRNRLANVLLLTGFSLLLYFSLDFVFVYAIWGYAELPGIFLHKLAIAGYSTAVTPVLYILVRKINRALSVAK